jgi:N-acyl-D-aspartate/D-glutamate deacylase
MTCLPANRVGIKKGDLAPGSDADIVIFDENSIQDTADFQEPRRQPLGIKWVMIAGAVAMQNGGLINGRLGRAVRV